MVVIYNCYHEHRKSQRRNITARKYTVDQGTFYNILITRPSSCPKKEAKFKLFGPIMWGYCRMFEGLIDVERRRKDTETCGDMQSAPTTPRSWEQSQKTKMFDSIKLGCE